MNNCLSLGVRVSQEAGLSVLRPGHLVTPKAFPTLTNLAESIALAFIWIPDEEVG